MNGFISKALDETTWPDFARLVERNNGVWGGCWCMGFHARGDGAADGEDPAAPNRARKERLVREGRTHAALVYDGEACVGWCQFGAPAELPRIKSRRAYLDGATTEPDWRITCFYSDKTHRKRGIASAALDGALREIARLGGGTVESYPEDAEGRTVAGAFLHNGTLRMFEQHGFARERRIGKNRWVVTRAVQ